ncbi:MULTISPECIES: hypothetical protein [Dermabacter]|uniref:hypothetical protein n=1 Tax=Dermabacter TaxID=36739 RepID=UPI0013747174|nr:MULTISPECIES: hypothetical protein [Dermabacter]MCT1708463.1 hypothetical protein [Dermabacter hominis]MDK8803028.1 hypothetical protein [Dermabacter hominis]UEB90557.1 hypothetical protein LK448_03455 [Dermabacter jinjuensis]
MNEQNDSAAGEARYFLILGCTVGKREQHRDFLYTQEKGWLWTLGMRFLID